MNSMENQRSGFSYEVYKALYLQMRLNKVSVVNNTDKWKVPFSGSLEYSNRFYGVLSEYMRTNKINIASSEMRLQINLLRLFANNRIRQGKKARVLDVMSYGEVMCDLGVGGVAIALTDGRTEEMKQYDSENGINFIKGDVLSSRTWNTLDRIYPEGGLFDFILCKPDGALTKIPSKHEIYAYLLGRMYPHLTQDNGILLSEVNSSYLTSSEFARSQVMLNRVNGISTFTMMGAFML